MKLLLIIVLALLCTGLAAGFWLMCIASAQLEDKIEAEKETREKKYDNYK